MPISAIDHIYDNSSYPSQTPNTPIIFKRHGTVHKYERATSQKTNSFETVTPKLLDRLSDKMDRLSDQMDRLKELD
jgi:hypothetical protein